MTVGRTGRYDHSCLNLRPWRVGGNEISVFKRCAWLAVMVLAVPVAPVHSEEPFTDSQEAEFVDGGRIHIKLSAGEHSIIENADTTIRVSWRVREKDIREVEAHTVVDGSAARIDIDGPNKNFQTVIEVPRHSDLVVQLSAGELNIGNIEGDKDIRLRAGELSVEVGDVGDYGDVKGSLWAGDIDAGPFNLEKSGLFRSIEWKGDGAHALRFKLWAGDVTLFQKLPVP
jgi:hypothetical protein